MENTFVLVQEIAKRWGLGYAERLAVLETQAAPAFAQLGDATRQARLRANLQRQAAYDVVHEEVNRFKGPAPHQNQSRTRGVLGLTEKQFEKASAKRAAFDVAEAAKPAKPAPRRAVTKAEFKKIKAAAVANGFMDLLVIGKAWGMKWEKTLEYMSFLDPSVKDTVQLIQGAIEKMDIPQQERRGLYVEEFDRLTAIGAQRQADQDADQQARNALVDAETDRLRAENARYEQAKADAFEAWDNRLKAARALVEEKWTEYYAKAKDSRANRDAKIEVAEAAYDEFVVPRTLELRAEIDALGEEPLSGPRFSKASEIWWTYQHARNALSLVYGNEVGVYKDAKREAKEDARDFHRESVWKWRKEKNAAIKPLTAAGYEIFMEGSESVDRADFDLKSRV